MTAPHTEETIAALADSLQRLERRADPFPHALARAVFPTAVAAALRTLPFAAAQVNGVSGKRELHNQTRRYFDVAARARHPACEAVAAAFQSPQVVRAIQGTIGAVLEGTYVRLEYAQDIDGFWLEPHTDLGVKRFTMLVYLCDRPDQGDLGTDLYAGPGRWAGRTPFVDNTALIFTPGADTWHGLERRPIAGVRRSVIMNYVTDAWRERGQLAYPETPVRA